jgi:hypothetical protein
VFLFRHYRESGNPVFVTSWIPARATPDFDPGLAGMTANSWRQFMKQNTRFLILINPKSAIQNPQRYGPRYR